MFGFVFSVLALAKYKVGTLRQELKLIFEILIVCEIRGPGTLYESSCLIVTASPKGCTSLCPSDGWGNW